MRALTCALLTFASTAFAQSTCPTTTDAFPTDDWPVQLVTGKDAEISALETFAFTIQGGLYARKGIHSNALVIIKHGTIVYEKYARGFTADNRHISWSVAKSFSSALIGIAARDGLLQLDDSICTHLDELSGSPQCAITVRDAITFGTGLDWVEDYEDGNYQTSSVLSMLFGVGHRDQLKHIATHRLSAEPGKQWRYSTGDAELASAVAKRALTTKYGNDAFWKVLFEPIGMKRVIFEEDTRGTPLGGSCIYATPREFAKFGYLYLHDGCWAGSRILPEDWVTASTTVSSLFAELAPSTEPSPSGYMWWLNKAVPSRSMEPGWKDVPADAYAALGHWGQRIIVVPSEDVVIVRTGDDREGSIDPNELIKLSLAVAK